MDFLTNGFHQLYSELDSDFTNWEYIENGSSGQTATKIDSIYSSDYYDFVNDEGSFELNAVLESDSAITFDHLQSEFGHDLDYLPSSKQETGEVDSKFLDDYIGLPELTNFLSERTPFCNESCNVFIKESSDNLNKYHPANETTSILEPKPIEDSEGEKIFPCSYGDCSKVYAKPAHLKAHLRRHLGDKPYVCNWPNCTWKFSRSDELARHKRSHSGIKPYKCTYCVKCFARSDHLSKHLKVHERKMAANKLKGILTNLHHVKPGRRPKNAKGFDLI